MRDAPEAGNQAPKDSLDGTRLLVICVCEAAEVGALKAWGQDGGSPSRNLAGGGEMDSGNGRGVGCGGTEPQRGPEGRDPRDPPGSALGLQALRQQTRRSRGAG